MLTHAWLLPLIVVIFTLRVKVKIVIRLRYGKGGQFGFGLVSRPEGDGPSASFIGRPSDEPDHYAIAADTSRKIGRADFYVVFRQRQRGEKVTIDDMFIRCVEYGAADITPTSAAKSKSLSSAASPLWSPAPAERP